MQSTDNNLAHSSNPGAQEKRDLYSKPWSLVLELKAIGGKTYGRDL